MTKNDHAHMQDLCDVIALDPGLAAACLRLASSVSFAGTPVNHLDQAVFLMGVAEIRKMALNLLVVGAFAPMQSRLHQHEFWLHNVCVAKLTHLIAGCTTAEHGYAYLAGLLHDLGKLIIERHFPDEYSAVLTAARESHGSQFQMERRLLGIDHAHIGALICRRLRIHEQVVEAVLHHHRVGTPLAGVPSPSLPGEELAACIAVADYLAHQTEGLSPGEMSLADCLSPFPQWHILRDRCAAADLRIDVAGELNKARQEFAAVAKLVQ